MTTIKNLNNMHLTAEQITKSEAALTELELQLKAEIVNLSADERRKYGSIGEANKLFVNKVSDYATGQPSLCSTDVDWEEFMKDQTSRLQLEGMIARMQNVLNGLINAKTLHDYDNYQAALDDYSYTTYKAGTSAPGFEEKQRDLKQFFSRTRAPKEQK